MKKIIVVMLTVIASIGLQAQQDAMYTHYMFNTLAVNPAYAGSSEMLTVTGLHRSQWISFPGAPRTQTLTLHSPLMKDQMGIGLSIINDKIGPTKTTSAYFDFTYRLKVSRKARLGFGIKAGFNSFTGEFQGLITDQDNDGVFDSNLNSKMMPNFGIGLYLDGEKYFVGLSSPNLLENDFNVSSADSLVTQFSQTKHYFFSAGVVVALNESVEMLPTGFIKANVGSPIIADVSTRFLFKKKYWLGAMYRTGDAVGLLAGLQINQQLAAGYSFDFSYGNETFTNNSGSHELMLRYDFIFNPRKKILSPRYF